MFSARVSHRSILAAIALLSGVAWVSCRGLSPVSTLPPTAEELLTVADLERLLSQGVETAERLGQSTVIAVTHRDGTVLAIFRMNGTESGPYVPPTAPGLPVSMADQAVSMARTAAFLSSNQHAFTTLTACFITREHFPPGLPNLAGGPLFGVPFSSLPGGDIQPNGNGLSGLPGGVPLFKNGILVGGLGVTGSDDAGRFDLPHCGGELMDEQVALGAATGFEPPASLRGDGIFLDGIRLLFANSAPPAAGFTLGFDDVLPSRGSVEPVTLADAEPSIVPGEGEVVLRGFEGDHDFTIRTGTVLTRDEVARIIGNSVSQAQRTRAAIRRPIGVPAQVFISVVDVDGRVLGIWRTPDATLFSFDVSVQKARTALAFSTPGHPLGATLRADLLIPPGEPLAVSTRAVGFLAQDFFPPGIDRDPLGHPVRAGPLFGMQVDLGLSPFGNGITIFPGGLPLFRDGALAGAIGVSGDGVDQDDLICSAGTKDFEAPPAIRTDRILYDGVRLPYVKFPRQPENP